MEMFSITVAKGRAKFSVEGKANMIDGSVMFYALLNGIAFARSRNYDVMRERVLKSSRIHTNNRSVS